MITTMKKGSETMYDPIHGIELDMSNVNEKQKEKLARDFKKFEVMSEEKKKSHRQSIRASSEKHTPTDVLIRTMENNARVLIKTLGKEEARRQVEMLLEQANTLNSFHPGFPEAVLAMAVRLDEMLEA